MKEYKLPLESFVGGYMAPAELCDEILDELEVPDPPDKSMASLIDESKISRRNDE